jgi:type I protein arginine methyltransferase
MSIDFARDDPASIHVMSLPFEFVASRTGLCHGIAAWFDVTFAGSTSVFVLQTGPRDAGTHWYQCRLLLRTPLAVNAGQRISGTLHMVANERWSYDLSLTMSLPGSEHTAADGVAISAVATAGLQDQLYYYMTGAAATTAT